VKVAGRLHSERPARIINSYEPIIHVIDSMFNQHAKWLEKCNELPWRAKRRVTQSVDHRSGLAARPQRFHPSGSLFSRRGREQEPSVVRIYLPPDANCLLSVADHCLRSVNYVNVIVADKQVHLQYLDMDAATAHCTKGAGIWDWASKTKTTSLMWSWRAAAMCRPWESLAATALLRQDLPDIKVDS